MAFALAAIDYITTKGAKLLGTYLGARDKATKKSKWHALPGNRLELGDTGYYIEMATGSDLLYVGYSPETWLIKSNSLSSVKEHLESHADARAEFSAVPDMPKIGDAKKGDAA